MSVLESVKTVPGVCGAIVAVAAAVTYAELLAGPPDWVRQTAIGPLFEASAGTTPNVFSATTWPAGENRYFKNASASALCVWPGARDQPRLPPPVGTTCLPLAAVIDGIGTTL